MKRILEIRASTVFQKSRPHLKILGIRKIANSKAHTDGPQIFGVTIKMWPPERPGIHDLCTPALHRNKTGNVKIIHLRC